MTIEQLNDTISTKMCELHVLLEELQEKIREKENDIDVTASNREDGEYTDEESEAVEKYDNYYEASEYFDDAITDFKEAMGEYEGNN